MPKLNKLLLFCFLITLSFVSQAKTFYVTDKVLVGVYEQPDPQSTLIKALPTGTPLEITETKGEYVNITSPDGTKGWVEKSYLIENKPSLLAVLELSDNNIQLKEQLALAQSELLATQTQLKTLTLSVGKETGNKSKQAKQIKSLKEKNATLTKTNNKLDKSLAEQKSKLDTNDKKILALNEKIAQLEQQLATLPTTSDNTATESTTANDEMAKLKAQNRDMEATLNTIRQAMSLPANSKSAVSQNDNSLTIKWTWLTLGLILLLLLGFIGGVKWLDWRNMQRHGGFRI